MILIILIPILIIYCLVVDSKYKEVKPFIVEAGQSFYFRRGEANGYLAIPEGHPLDRFDYMHDWEKYPVVDDIHGGCTWSEFDEREENPFAPCWSIGFDTAHSFDNAKIWPKYRVRQETEHWAQKVNNYFHPLY